MQLRLPALVMVRLRAPVDIMMSGIPMLTLDLTNLHLWMELELTVLVVMRLQAWETR